MITVEDIIEEIFGDFDDEHDTENLVEEKLSDHVFRFSARHEIYYLNEEYGRDIQESDDYGTLAGFIITNHQSIPEVGQEISIDHFDFAIDRMDGTRIEEVTLRVGKKDR